jgi:hypothetical protein
MFCGGGGARGKEVAAAAARLRRNIDGVDVEV